MRLNSFMSWIGGKKALRELIVTLFPVYYERYIEVFGGGGWVLFHKPPGNDFEVYNDFNSLLVNLYRCVRDKPQELMEALRYVLNSREDFDVVRATLARDSPASDVQKAAWFYELIRYSYAAGLTSFGSQPHDMWSNFPLIEQAHRRLAKVVIENKDFEKLVRQYDRPASLFYLDPPYHATEGYYQNIGEDGFTETDHIRLRDALMRIEGISHYYTLNGIKSKTVGDGQHGTARWATKQEIRQTYAHIPFEPELWRKGEHLPEKQGLILGCEGPKNHVTALVDTDDIHAMVTAASGAGKTAFFLYPNIEYALASGMSFLCTDTKGDLFRNYAGIAKDCYGYQIAVLDLRNPTRSDGNNLLHLINKYMDIYKANPNDLAAKAKAEKYSKILAKTLINTSGGDSAQYGQNAFFYDSAEGLLTAMFLLVAEYLPTEDEDGNPVEKRHIVSVFKLVQELLAPSKVKGKNQFQLLLEKLPPNHKARWFAGSALNTAEQAMASVISTVLSRLNAFLDSEMEQILCFDTAIDAEKFCTEKSAIFIVLPEEDQTKYFMVSLILQNLYREILTVADENGGRLKNRVVFFADELGTCPPIQSLELMFSASRSRGLMLVPIVQSITGQLKKNYGAEGAEVIVDNCQVNLYGGFAPASQTAVELSKALGSRTVMSGSISRGKNDPSQSLQMIERPLMTPDELKSMPKGSFIVAKTGVHPMKVKLRLFLDWGIRFGEPYEVPEKAQRAVAYADKQELEESIIRRHYGTVAEEELPQDAPAAVGGMNHGMQIEKNSRKAILRP